MSSLIFLDAGVQNYAWGKPASSSFVARMKKLTHDTSGKMYAELWVGTHPSCPSRVIPTDVTATIRANDPMKSDTQAQDYQLLDDYLKDERNKSRFYSPAHQASAFHDTVPYLLKVLSVNSALSVQAHPCKSLAAKLHAEKPDKYKDPNHKPQLICALTPFEALCCFRSLRDIVSQLKVIPQLAQIVCATSVLGKHFEGDDSSEAAATLPAADSDEEKHLLKSLMQKLYDTDTQKCATALKSHLARVKAKPRCEEDKVFARVYGQYPDDVGCWMVYFLNYVQLLPGDALFLSDSEPHAYLSGDGVQIMACSDNVVRAGFTPKWKDVHTLIEMLKYDTTGLTNAKYARNNTEYPSGWQVQYYQPPSQFPDFSLYRFQYNHDDDECNSASVVLPTIGLGFCLEGCAKVNGTDVKVGDCFAVPYGPFTCQSNGKRSLVFVASTNDLERSSKV